MSSRKPMRRPISLRLSLTLTTLVVLLTAGITFAFYREFIRVVDYSYKLELEHICNAGSTYVDSSGLAQMVEVVDSDEFRAVRAKAIAENNDKYIVEFLHAHKTDYDIPLDAVYDDSVAIIRYTQESMTERSASVYIQYMKDGNTFTLIDMDGGLLAMGEEEQLIPIFSGDADNAKIEPTIYHSQYGYLMSAADPINDTKTGRSIATFCVDVDYNDAVHDRIRFILDVLLAEVLIAAVITAIIIWRVRRIVVGPLKKLATGMSGFKLSEDDLSYNDVIDIKLKHNDEINDLYREIRAMQTRIIDNTEYITRVTTEKERLNTEMDMAAKIQGSALPEPALDHASFTVSASMTPAKAVGGDFYDYFFIDDDHLALVIADVSDKGVPAALFMMSAKMLIRSRTTQGGTPAQILEDVNTQLYQNNTSGMFITVWLGILDINSGSLTCTNAGHEYPFLRRDGGSFTMLSDEHGIALGMFPEASYSDYTIKLSPGDIFFTYTDGVTEANRGDNDLFGMDRTCESLNRVDPPVPESVIRSLSEDILAFLGECEPFDDVTMLCLMYKG